MSNPGMRLPPGALVAWGTMIIGLWGAWYAGNQIADDGYAGVLLDIAFLFGVLAVITARRYWWIPVFFVGICGFSTMLPGFKMDGTDLMALFGFGCLFAMLSMGHLHPKNTQKNLGLFFYLLIFYVCVHAAVYGVDNYFNGDTQFKNIAKRYYALIAPLVLVWCMDRYAHPKGMRKTINLMLLAAIVFSIVGVVVTMIELPIPGLTGSGFNFAWADPENVRGYLRGVPPFLLLLALCMMSSGPSGWDKYLYWTAILVLLPAAFFGGGRLSLLVIMLYVACWLMIRKKWKQVLVWGWLLAIGAAGMAVAGRTMDARQLQEMPQSFQNVQRAISLFIPSDQVNDAELETSASDQWHQDLVQGAWDYSKEDYKSMILGNGFKGWDDSIDMNKFTFGEAYDAAVKTAVRMGASETMFFSILPILGWVGVVLYYGFVIELLRRNLKVLKFCPQGTLARSLCEFAFCSLLTTLIISPISGAIPAYGMIFWMIGFIAAEPYLATVVAPKLIREPVRPPMPMFGTRGGMMGR